MRNRKRIGNSAGFSLIELMIAMTATLVMLGIATTALSTGFRIRDREESVTDAAADAQRALNIMSREIANAGFNLSTNGIVPGDSDASSIRIRSNLNKYDSTASSTSQNGVVDAGEDLKYFVNTANNTDYLVRYDANATSGQTTVLANRLDQIRIHYFDQKTTYSTSDCDISGASSSEVSPGAAKYIVIAVCVRIPASGSPNTAGYQPASKVLLVSDVTLRNSLLSSY
jgi:prepilin-type N-terminal cleavage/methylation domain-containing protein